MPEAAPAQARRARPRNRRELILTAAAEMFSRHGYHQVAMSDLAGAVGIGPSALYRHFSGKEDVLAHVVENGLRPARDAVAALDDAHPGTATGSLASQALDQRRLGLLWQREARGLSPGTRQRLSSVVRELGAGLAAYARAVRPGLDARTADLLAWAAIAVLTSPAFHRLDLPRPGYDRLLAELVTTVLDTDVRLPLRDRSGRPQHRLEPASRREHLLDQAIRKFAAHGYAQVGIEDIGHAVGISGPSVYNHWPTKIDLLTTALQRAAAALAMDVAGAYRLATDPADALNRLADSYVTRSHTHPEIFSLLITDMHHLPEAERHSARRAQHDYISEWTHLLLLDQPGVDPVAARIRVHAALSVAHDTARTPHLRRDPAVAAAVRTVCIRLLTACGPVGPPGP